MTLLEQYAGIVSDLDGVVYRGEIAVEHAVEAYTVARAQGRRIVYATNNASRPPTVVHEHLTSLGLTLEVADVLTSAQAGARHLADELDPGTEVVAIGGEGVRFALREAGLLPVRPRELSDAQRPAAVLQGLGVDVTWSDLAEGAVAIHRGARWVATNADTTLPTPRGLLPGNGAMVGALRHAVGIDPLVVGKPHPPLYLRCADLLGCAPEESLAVGDRLDTDIAGAVAAGMDSLYVRTGVSTPGDVARADVSHRPTYLGLDLRVLHEDYDEPRLEQTGVIAATCGEARVALVDGALQLGFAGTGTHRLRALVAVVWAGRDAGEEVDVPSGVDAWVEEGTA